MVRRIGVLMGGTSAEREVSLRSGAAVSGALKGLGYDVVDIDAGPDVCATLRAERIDVAFIVLHGGLGEDGSIQGMLDVMAIPYTGSGVLASALAMDKPASKAMFKAHGLIIAEHLIAARGEACSPRRYPVVVKPSREGSSVGVSIIERPEDLQAAIDQAASFDGIAVIEEYIKGQEVQIAIMGGRPLGGVEVRPHEGFYSYENKYTAGKTDYIIPPELDAATYERAALAALGAHNALGCRGATRVDLIIDKAGTPYVLEVNTIPGMTETSLLPKIAASAGLSFPALINEMLKEALER